MNCNSDYNWSAIGPSGGGQTLAATISPHDANIVFCASDMGGAYRSTDGGRTFTLINGHVLSRLCCDFNITPIAFHPTEKNTVYFGAWNGLFVSRDNGESFEQIDNFGMGYGPSRIDFDNDGTGVLAYNDMAAECTVLKDFDGKTLFRTEKRAVGVAIYGKTILLCTKDSVYISLDRGNSFKPVMSCEVLGFCKCDSVAYFTTKTEAYKADLKTGEISLLYRPDFGELRHVAAVENKIYLGFFGSDKHFDGDDMSTILLSADNGKTFVPTLFQHPKNEKCNLEKSWVTGRWGWHCTPSCLAVTKADPDMVIYSNFTGMGISRDGGKSFFEASAAYDSSGIQVMTSWDYVIDPHDDNIHYIAMTDFSGWRSEDGGNTWEHAWNGNPWKSNIYGIAPHPTEKGRLLAGASNVHDLPYWHWIRRQTDSWGGGIICSFDSGKTWRPQDTVGVGPFGVVTDVKYYKNKAYAAIFGHGLYVTDEAEEYWKILDRDITEQNVAKLSVCDDCLFVTVWPKKDDENVIPGAVYRSTDGEHFERLPLCEEIKYPITVLPLANDEVYVSCFDCIDYCIKGRKPIDLQPELFGKPGLYHTADGGKSWERLYDGGVYSATQIEDELFICSKENGLLSLKDGVLSQHKNLPVINPHTVTVGADGSLYVTSFGQGVYKGTPTNQKEAL